MGTGKQQNIRFEPWVREAIEVLAAEHKIDFSKEVENLLIVQLAHKGYSEAAWLTKTYGIDQDVGEVPSGENPQEAQKAQ
ncbi:MAG: hypothetical protein LBK08_11725 [Treponema sp.]|jgi:hypothetical protein|nr:hypothetical protein [Treponema sp.]